MGMNTSAMGSISATINGTAHVLEKGSEEEGWCKAMHLANNTFDGESEGGAQRDTGNAAQSQAVRSLLGEESSGGPGSGSRDPYIEDEDVRVVVVRIREGRISDWKGGVSDWVLEQPGEHAGGAQQGMVNGN